MYENIDYMYLLAGYHAGEKHNMESRQCTEKKLYVSARWVKLSGTMMRRAPSPVDEHSLNTLYS